MNCPRCNNLLDRIDADGLELDYCAQCHGVWFDKGEIRSFFGLPSDLPEENLPKSLGKPKRMKCPSCPEGNLFEVQYTGRANLMVDKCDLCSGFWFDGGEVAELKKLAPMLTTVKDQVRYLLYHARKSLKG